MEGIVGEGPENKERGVGVKGGGKRSLKITIQQNFGWNCIFS